MIPALSMRIKRTIAKLTSVSFTLKHEKMKVRELVLDMVLGSFRRFFSDLCVDFLVDFPAFRVNAAKKNSKAARKSCWKK